MGVVYRARHALMRRDTAVKLLLPDRANDDSIQRFEREVCLTCQLTHPNTIQVYDYGHTPEGIFYYAMELLRGVNLHHLVARFGPQPEGRVAHILIQVCESLAEAHTLGLVHRDIKPANVFLCNRAGIPDCVKVLDFGLIREYRAGASNSQATRKETFVGTPSFMAPESVKNPTKSDPRSDIYSVAAVGYFLLTGTRPFAGDGVAEIYEQQLTTNPERPGLRTSNVISVEMEDLILRCLDRKPENRPQTAGELRSLLLNTPRVFESNSDTRAAWWAKFGDQASELGDAGTTTNSAPTVKIDFASRMK
jgi:serine/threonine protein kinase